MKIALKMSTFQYIVNVHALPFMGALPLPISLSLATAGRITAVDELCAFVTIAR